MLRQIIRKQEAELLEVRLAGALKDAVPSKHEQEGERGLSVSVSLRPVYSVCLHFICPALLHLSIYLCLLVDQLSFLNPLWYERLLAHLLLLLSLPYFQLSMSFENLGEEVQPSRSLQQVRFRVRPLSCKI